MAGTVNRNSTFKSGDSALIVTYTFEYGDEFDGTAWDDPDLVIDEGQFDLVGDIVIDIVDVGAPSTWVITAYKNQGQGRGGFFSATLTATDTPMLIKSGRGGAPKSVGDFRGYDVERES